MCGIVGWKQWTSEINLAQLQNENAKRGGYSTGMYNWTTLTGKKDKSTITVIQEETTIVQYRQPTTDKKGWVDEENYPLMYKDWLMFGNGTINASYYKSIKDEENNNDLYYILKGIRDNGFDFLKDVEGTFALIVLDGKRDIYLVRKDFPIFYTQNVISSVKFDKCNTLYHGVLYNWTNNLVVEDLGLDSVYAD